VNIQHGRPRESGAKTSLVQQPSIEFGTITELQRPECFAVFVRYTFYLCDGTVNH